MRYLTRQSKCITMSSDNGEYNSPKGGGLAWQLDVGAECNVLTSLANQIETDPVFGATEFQVSARCIRSIVARVAEMEQLEGEPDDSQSKMP